MKTEKNSSLNSTKENEEETWKRPDSSWECRLRAFSERFNRFMIAEMLAFKTSPVLTVFTTFLGGLAMGLGLALGLTVLSGLSLMIAQEVVEADLPVIGEYLAEIYEVTIEHLD
ncbi:DUF5665 domain-containing protein [Halarsenatibacter silvermanii]|uniref:Uncharacterized protein n=1 Tax=Halarsenatibacter silvermanii TaxID=321763 RepID=A0A1G9PR20_9FIRM|nr:DUF5665 domain-containing protein [Halarsenatibacter silvermanii]SDM01216.1 hypothetical protein SAMN04488692_1142 [Halarsenatibacter silvermanii]